MTNIFKKAVSNLFKTETSFQRKSFKAQTKLFWQKFVEEESEIRKLLDQKVDSEILIPKIKSILNIASSNLAFEIGINPENKYELTLSPNGDRVILLQIEYLLSYKPTSLDHLWSFYSAKPAQGDRGYALDMYDLKVTDEDLRIYPNIDNDNQTIHLEIFAPILSKIDEGSQYNVIFNMLDLYIGELYTMKHITTVDILDNAQNDKISTPLTELKTYIDNLITEHNWNNSYNFLENLTGYQAEPATNDKELRSDIYIGYSAYFDLIQNFQNDSNSSMLKQLQTDGIYMGYVYYDNSQIDQDSLINLRVEIEDKIVALTEEQSIAQSTGAATGNKNSYIDFIIYDLDEFIQTTKLVLGQYKFPTKGIGFFSEEKIVVL